MRLARPSTASAIAGISTAISLSCSTALGSVSCTARIASISSTSPCESGPAASSSRKAAIRASTSCRVRSPIAGPASAKASSAASKATRLAGTSARPEKRSIKARNRRGRQICRRSAALRRSVVLSPSTAAMRIPMSPVAARTGKPRKTEEISAKTSASASCGASRSKISYPTCRYSLARFPSSS